MKNRSCLLTAVAAVWLLAAWPGMAAAYISILPPTLGDLCRQSTHVSVLRVEKVSTENGVILFKSVQSMKAEGMLPLPDGTHTRQVIRPNIPGAKVILDWAAEGKTAIIFAKDFGIKSAAHVYIDGYWYFLSCDVQGNCWAAVHGEPTMLTRYCGTADKLGEAVTKILRGEEVVVPGMAKDDRKALLEGRGKVQNVQASLKILGNFKENIDLDAKPEPEGKKPEKKPVDPKPDEKKPGEKKPDENKPAFVGTVKALSTDGKSFTLVPSATEKNKEPTPIDIQIGDGTTITAGKEPGKLAVGQIVSVWMGKGETKIAARIQIGKPTEPEKKPVEKKPEEKKADVVGTVKALSADGKRLTVQTAPAEKGKEPGVVDIQIGEGTKIIAGKESGKLAVGQTVNVWLAKGEGKVATLIEIGRSDAPPKKPLPDDKTQKPAPDKLEQKPEEPKKPKEPAKPARDPAPTATLIDAEIDQHLVADKIPASPQADDAEFLRRVTLDLTGRIPTYQQTIAFLDSKDPDKRRKLIDELLDSPAYGQHFAAVWRDRLLPRELNVNGKGGGQRESFSPWLAEQFNDNRGWNSIVVDLLTAEGTPTDNPATAFLIANGENGRLQPNKMAGSVAGLFWGVNLRCAECHNHPFAQWKQQDFWGTAAFFGKVQYGGGGGKGGPAALTESATGVGSGGKEKGQPGSPMVRGAAIVIPSSSGKAAGQVIKARFLGGAEPSLDEKEPFRPQFAAWATAADNPYFARAAVNRMWAHFFGRGFVNPLDAFDTGSPSHPELLDRLAKEFTTSGFDLKHLARCITSSKAYQRSSRPVPGNEADSVAFSHMSIKVLTPEVLYDALGTIGKDSGNLTKTGGNTGKGSGEKGSGNTQESREVFLRSFRVDEDVPATEYIQGIPQLLRMMNASSPNRGAAIVESLCQSGASRSEAINTLYLTVLSRRPTTAEVELMSSYLSRRKDDREGYRGVLWILLNSSEFALNH